MARACSYRRPRLSDADQQCHATLDIPIREAAAIRASFAAQPTRGSSSAMPGTTGAVPNSPTRVFSSTAAEANDLALRLAGRYAQHACRLPEGKHAAHDAGRPRSRNPSALTTRPGGSTPPAQHRGNSAGRSCRRLSSDDAMIRAIDEGGTSLPASLPIGLRQRRHSTAGRISQQICAHA